MATPNTHQQLERNTKQPCQHDPFADGLCIDCIVRDLNCTDFRYDVALVAAIDLKKLAALRAAIDGAAGWRDRWLDVLEPARLQQDLAGDDLAIRRAAEQARRSVSNFLRYRIGIRSDITADVARCLLDIEARTRARLVQLRNEGSEPELLGHLDN